MKINKFFKHIRLGFLFLVFVGFFISEAFSNNAPIDSSRYKYYIEKSKKFYKNKSYDSSYLYFRKSLSICDTNVEDLYNASKVSALSGHLDYSYFLIRRIVLNLKGTNYLDIIDEPNLKSLFKDPTFSKLINNLFDSLLTENYPLYSKKLRNGYYRLYIADQTLRKQLNFKYNTDSLFKIINKTDSINLIILSKLIDSLGFLPNKSYVGLDMSIVPFLIIQHGTIEVRKKYLPFFKEECHKGNFPKFIYPYLMDRVCMDEDKPQLFGTQLSMENDKWELYKIDDIKLLVASKFEA